MIAGEPISQPEAPDRAQARQESVEMASPESTQSKPAKGMGTSIFIVVVGWSDYLFSNLSGVQTGKRVEGDRIWLIGKA